MKIFTAVFAVLISIGCFWFSSKMILLYFKVKSWDRVEAHITDKKIGLHEKYSTGRTPYKVEVNYSYSYKNNSYQGKNLFLVELIGGQANFLKGDAESHVAKIADNMTIYVNPENPKESVIYCDGVVLYFFVFGMGLIALIVGASKLF